MKKKNSALIAQKLEELKAYEKAVNDYNEKYLEIVKQLNESRDELNLYEPGTDLWGAVLKKVQSYEAKAANYQELRNEQHENCERLRRELSNLK